jgi:hypothetical protein
MVAIVGGSLSATASSAAGIGGGRADGPGSNASVAALTVAGGDVSATGTSGAGIGAGYSLSSGSASIGTLTISNGRVSAVGAAGAGIGAGGGYAGGSSPVGALTIAGGAVTARGSSSGAGIGAGYASAAGAAGVATVRIAGGAIGASSAYGAGIGAAGDRLVGRLTIANANITAAGVDAPAVGGDAPLRLEGGLVIDAHAPVYGSDIRVANASLRGLTPGSRFFGAPPYNDGGSELVLLYGARADEGREQFAKWGGALLQVGSVNLSAGRWKICLATGKYEKCFGLDGEVCRSFTASVAGSGKYVVCATSVERAGHLEGVDGASFEVDGFTAPISIITWDFRRRVDDLSPKIDLKKFHF